MSRWITISVLALAFAATAGAQTEVKSAKQLATEIVDLVQTESSFDELMKSVASLQVQLIQQQGGSADGTQVDAMMKKLGTVLKDEFSTTLKQDMVTAYASVFTAEELQGLLDFYRSPVGKKLVEKTPELTRTSMQLQEKNFARLWPKIDQVMKEYMRENPPQ